MNGAATEVIDLVVRWVHVIAGIMWVGNSMLFNWLDRNLRTRDDTDVYGDIWLLHSGGFYLVEKNKGERSATGLRSLPRPLHWFKWQAYITWLSGAALLVVVYYLGGRALLVDPAVADISSRAAVAIAVGTIVIGVVLYEAIWRVLGARAYALATILSVALLVVAIEFLLSRLGGRAAYLHVGALLGTIMAANVANTIMPSQRELVAALSEGREPSQAIADRAKTRSIHNNYLTFPVIVLMLSAHFPSLYARGRSDLTLFVLIAAGAAVRHVMNIRFTFARWRWALAGVVATAALLLVVQLVLPSTRRATIRTDTAAVSFDDARRVIDRRCTACHSSEPSDVSLGAMPGGVAFDTPDQVRLMAPRILERVTTRTMPPGNKTRMTDAERTMIAAWATGQNQLPR
jgi:uncharacterized membrane protein